MQGLPSKFSNPAFCHLISPIDLSSKSGSSHFPGSLCRLRGEVFRRDLLGRASTLRGKQITLYFLKRNLQSLECTILIRGRSACLFFGQPRGQRCNVASCSPQGEYPYRYTRFPVIIFKKIVFTRLFTDWLIQRSMILLSWRITYPSVS